MVLVLAVVQGSILLQGLHTASVLSALCHCLFALGTQNAAKWRGYLQCMSSVSDVTLATAGYATAGYAAAKMQQRRIAATHR